MHFVDFGVGLGLDGLSGFGVGLGLVEGGLALDGDWALATLQKPTDSPPPRSRTAHPLKIRPSVRLGIEIASVLFIDLNSFPPQIELKSLFGLVTL
jgi:hypothetical protein